MIRKITLALSTLGLALMLSVPASADVLNFALFDPPQYTVPGTVLTFNATVSAPNTNSAALFLNSDSFNIDFPLTLDDSGFFNNFPLSLNPGDTFTGQLFTVTVPPDATLFVPFNGYFEIDGGPDNGTLNYLSSVTFQVEAVPEPATAVMLLAGLSGLAFAIRRKRRIS